MLLLSCNLKTINIANVIILCYLHFLFLFSGQLIKIFKLFVRKCHYCVFMANKKTLEILAHYTYVPHLIKICRLVSSGVYLYIYTHSSGQTQLNFPYRKLNWIWKKFTIFGASPYFPILFICERSNDKLLFVINHLIPYEIDSDKITFILI